MDENPESVRIQYKYRKLIMEGKVRIPLSAAKRLIGADSIYRLYGSDTNYLKDDKSDCSIQSN